ncbi:hypothetical protein FA95DRAFT_1621741, partial [Auriscalpium vulgare]
ANDSRSVAAVDIIQSGRLVCIASPRPFEVWATCAASGSILSDQEYPRYWLTLHATGSATCTCPDWLQRGGACKHIRSLAVTTKLSAASQAEAGTGANAYNLPTSLEAATLIRERNKLWYAGQPTMAPTAPLCPMAYPQGYLGLVPPPSMTVAAPTDPIATITLPPPEPADSQPPLADEIDLTVIAEPDGPDEQPEVIEHAPENADEEAGGMLPEEGRTEGRSPEPSLRVLTICLHKNPTNETAANPAAVEQEAWLNVQAVELQRQHHVEQDVHHLLPRLHGLSGTLADMSSLEATDKIIEFHSLIDTLGDQLRELSDRRLRTRPGDGPDQPAGVPIVASTSARNEVFYPCPKSDREALKAFAATDLPRRQPSKLGRLKNRAREVDEEAAGVGGQAGVEKTEGMS